MPTPVEELAAEIEKIDFEDSPTPTPDVTPAEPAAEAAPSTPESEAKPQDAAPQPEKPADGEADATPEPKETDPAGSPPAIPDSHYRAALHMGYTSEEIGELYDANPALALKTLAKAHETMNAASRQLGELGQRARQLRAEPPAAASQSSRKEVVMKQLKEKYEDDPIIDLIGELIPDTVPVPEIKGFRHEAEPTPPDIEQEVAIRQQINTFFTADEMEVYDDFYGKTSQTGVWDTLTPGQRANRIEVCNRAQMILDGAALTGMQMSAAEALERAHLEVAAPLAERFIRERIVKSVQKRAAGVTLKPSGAKAPLPTGQYSKEQAVQDMKAELKKVFGS